MIPRTVRRGIPFLILFANWLFGFHAEASLPKNIFAFDAANRLTNTITPLNRETRLNQ